MKMKRIVILLSILLLGILLTSCTSATATNSWGGVSANDTNVFITDTTSIKSLSADSGSVVWTYPDKPAATRLFYAAPAVAGDQLIIGDYSGLLVAVGIRDGKELWQFKDAKGHYVYSPLVVNDTIIAPNADSNIYALDLSGKLVWTFNGTHAFWATPVSDGTTVYATSLDHYLYAINLADGKLKWKADLGASLVGSPAISQDGVLYVGTLGSELFALKAEDGSVVWKQSMAGTIWSAPLIVDQSLYIGDASGKINILATADGKTISSVDMQSAILGSGAIVASDELAFADEKSDVIFIGLKGERKFTPSVTGKLYSNLAFSNGHLYVLSTKGDKALYAFDANGTQIWSYSDSK